MNDAIFNDIAIEEACNRNFDIDLKIQDVIVRGITTGVASQATLFKTAQNTHYLYVSSPSNMTFGDVRKIVQRMNLEAEQFLPPRGDNEYFRRIGVEKFKQMFPGKHLTSDEDIRYYQTLAKYNPALVRISRFKGEINAYTIATQQWRKVKDYAYAKMKVQ